MLKLQCDNKFVQPAAHCDIRNRLGHTYAEYNYQPEYISKDHIHVAIFVGYVIIHK